MGGVSVLDGGAEPIWCKWYLEIAGYPNVWHRRSANTGEPLWLWYPDRVTGGSVVLPLGAALVLGLGVYLFVEVRADPGPLVAPSHAPRPAPPDHDAPPTGDSPTASVSPSTSARPGVQTEVRPDVRTEGASPSRAPGPAGSAASPTPDPTAATDAKLDAVMSEANKAYDHGDLEEAKTIAGRVLAHQPDNVRMLRIMVSSSCIDGDLTVAQASFLKLPPSDQEAMRVRCSRYGVALSDKPGATP
jgi:hypothetical protein